jgi:hypothetical protein
MTVGKRIASLTSHKFGQGQNGSFLSTFRIYGAASFREVEHLGEPRTRLGPMFEEQSRPAFDSFSDASVRESRSPQVSTARRY